MLLVALRSLAADNGTALESASGTSDLAMRLDFGRFGNHAPASPVADQRAVGFSIRIGAASAVEESPERAALWPLQLSDSMASIERVDGAPREILGVEWRWPGESVMAATSQGGGGILGSGWRLPPYSWAGSVSTSVGVSQTTSGTRTYRSTMFNESTAFSLRSFVISPTVAPLSGSLGLTRSSSNQSNTAETEDQATSSRGTELNATLSTVYLPYSLSPTEGNYAYRSNSGNNRSPMTSHAISVRKHYPVVASDYVPKGTYNFNFWRTTNYEGGDLTSGFDAFSVNAGDLRYDTIPLAAYASVARQTNRDGAQPASYMASLSGSHDYQVESTDMTLHSTGSTSISNNGQGNAAYTGSLGTAYNWYPDPDSDLQLTGGLSGGNTLLVTPEQRTHFGSVLGTVSSSYKFFDYLTVGAGAALGMSWADGEKTMTGSLVLSSGHNKTYQWGKSAEILGFTYNGTASIGGGLGLSLSGSRGADSFASGNTGLTLTIGAIADQSLSRRFVINERQGWNASFSESVSVSTGGFGTSAVAGIVHRALWNYNFNISSNTYLNAGAEFIDSRATESASSYSHVSANAKGGFDIPTSKNGRLNGSLVFSAASVLGNTDPGSGNLNWSVGGTLDYFNGRWLNIPRATYRAGYAVTLAPESNVAGAGLFMSHSLAQSLSYSIGKTAFQLSNSFAIISGAKNVTIFGTVSRSLGG